jgi:N-acetylglucosaminyldiphosphoundecaprenol N-acetyl-beta-D-mannosaminyltransferase
LATEALVFERLTTLDSPELVSAEPALRRPRVDLGGTQVDRLDRQAALKRIDGFLWSGQPHQVVTVNLDFLSIAERDDRFRALINAADLAVADGMPLVWLSRLRGEPLVERVAGVELVEDSCALAAQTGHGVFLLGAGPGVAATAAERLKERHPGLRIVGTYSPPKGPLERKESDRLVRMIREAAPGFLFVALGAPRQDIWIHENLRELNVPVSMGVGCVFDLLAGVSSRAPRWMQTAGLEWSYRLLREPRRLWRRYILNDLPLFGRLLLSARQLEMSESESVAVAST